MKKIWLFSCCFYAFGALAAEQGDLSARYQAFKNELQEKTGLTYSLDASFLPQRGAPSGKGTAWQTQYYGTLGWNMFSSEKWGSATLNTAYTLVQYWGKSGAWLGNRLGVLADINDYSTNTKNFDELSLTYTLGGSLKSLSLTLGQFPLYNFDGTDYNSNQQINFINEALAQNASDVYPMASLGGYVTWAPNSVFSITAGAQNANNIEGETISWSDFEKGKVTPFVSAGINPTFNGLAGEYSVLLYYQPSVGAQPESSRGWSLNAQQFISKKVALFARANGTNQSQNPIRQSYMLGGVVNNPFDRNSLDQIGLAVAMNKSNKAVNPAGTRAWESVVEGYMAFGISSFATITPDVQLYINPASSTKDTATVVSLRATLMF